MYGLQGHVCKAHACVCAAGGVVDAHAHLCE